MSFTICPFWPISTGIFRTAVIDWVVEEPYVGLVKQNRYINEVIPFALETMEKKHFFMGNPTKD